LKSSILLAAAAVLALALTGCGGGGGSSAGGVTAVALRGTAAVGSPIGSNLNGIVTIKDSSTPAKTATTPTDGNGNYSFSTTQLSGMTGPYMLEITYEIGGVTYYLTSAATSQDLANGPATIDITPLTNLVISNLAHEIAAELFTNGNYSSILTPAALASGANALATQLQPLLMAEGLTGSVDLLHQSFSANGTGLDAVLDALHVVIDPATNTARISNTLNGTTITNNLAFSPLANATVISLVGSAPLPDLQAIINTFTAFATELAKAPLPTDPALVAFFDPSHFLTDGLSLSAFLQQITTQPTVQGGTLAFTDISLDAVPSWVTTVPSGATAYGVHFTVLADTGPNGREEFIVYKPIGSSTWLLLGNQEIAKAQIVALETLGTNSLNQPAMCSGLQLSVNNEGGLANLSYAMITGPGLPAGGVLLFNSGTSVNSNDFLIATGGLSTYIGANTPAVAGGSSNCNYTQLYALSDALITTLGPSAQYTIKLYSDNGTPMSLTDDVLLATYQSTVFEAPLLNSELSTGLFSTVDPIAWAGTGAAILGDANGSKVASATFNWIAPTAPGLYASDINVRVSTNTKADDVSVNVPWNATRTTVAIPLLANTTSVGVTINYLGADAREYWSSVNYPAI
jgi:hypothetical protein